MSTEKNESFAEQGGKKAGNVKRKGSVVELERLKKREKELHVMKLSQEWDARRQKRRMDRQKWLQQRRDQNLPIWQRVGHLRVQATDETKLRVPSATKPDARIKATKTRSPNNDDKLQEPCTVTSEVAKQAISQLQTDYTVARDTEMELLTPDSAENERELDVRVANQDYKSVVVKLERRDSSEFCKSNQSQPSSPISNHGIRGTESKDGYQNKTWRHYEQTQLEGEQEPRVGAYQQLVTMVNSHPIKSYVNNTATDKNDRFRQHSELDEQSRQYPETDERFRQHSEINQRSLQQSGMEERLRLQYELNERSRQHSDMGERARTLSDMDERLRLQYEVNERSREHSDVDERTRQLSDMEERTQQIPDISARVQQHSTASVIVQAMRQSGIPSTVPEPEPSLLLASEPVRFEEVIREGGTNIQRLETSKVGIIGKGRHTEQINHQDAMRRSPSPGTFTTTAEQRRTPDQDFQQIRRPSFQTQDKTISDDVTTGSPVPASSIAMVTTNSNTTEKHPTAYSTSNIPPQPSPSGFLVPVFQPTVGEVVYAFVPGSSAANVDLRPRLQPGTPAHNFLYHGTVPRYPAPGLTEFPRTIHPSATVHHGRHAPIPRVELAKRTAEAARYDYARTSRSPLRDAGFPTRDTKSPNRSTGSPGYISTSPMRDTGYSTRVTGSPERETTSSLREMGSSMMREMGSPLRDSRSFVHVAESPRNDEDRFSDCDESPSSYSSAQPRQISMATEGSPIAHAHAASSGSLSKGRPSPELDTHAQLNKTSDAAINGLDRGEFGPPSGINGQRPNSTSSSPFSATSSEAIMNPTAMYVRPKLVPREILAPAQYGGSCPSGPVMEYIKTDSICNKQLVNWTARDVADFVAATDCADNASIFLDQDIDGKAVLLLSQDIFVNRLSLKLGTAMKLYNHIANLRTAMLM